MIPPSYIDTARNLIQSAAANNSGACLTPNEVAALADELTNLAADLDLEGRACDGMYESLKFANDTNAILLDQIEGYKRDLAFERQLSAIAEQIINNLTDQLWAERADRAEEEEL